MNELRFMDFADQTPTPTIMRLAWGSPVQILEGDTMRFFINDTQISSDMEYLHRHPYQNRQERIHALWQVGCRKEAQKVYWQGKLKKVQR